MRRLTLLPAAVRALFPGGMVLLALLSLLAVAPQAGASNDIEVRRSGSSWARIEDGGNVRIEGRLVGSIDEDGNVRVSGRLEGRVEKGGAIRENGRIVGSMEEDGTIRSEGTLIGRIEKDGTIRRQGALWGSVSPCCPGFRDVRRVAALLAFFDRGYFSP